MRSNRLFGRCSVLVLVWLAGCERSALPPAPDAGVSDAGAADAAPVDAAPVDASVFAPTFEADVWPVLGSHCQGCHFVTDNPPQIFEAAPTYERLVGGRSPTTELAWITPGDPEASYLLMKIEGTHMARGGRGTQMPPPGIGAEPLTVEQRALVRAWIQAGAPLR